MGVVVGGAAEEAVEDATVGTSAGGWGLALGFAEAGAEAAVAFIHAYFPPSPAA